MRDIDIRRVLRSDVRRRHEDEPDTVIVEELGLCKGVARVDLAVVNGSVHGYEIKSDQDTLARLPGQAEVYSRVFDFVTVIASPTHLANIRALVPKWWGMSAAVAETRGVQIVVKRQPRRNPCVHPYSLAELLWRDEALDALAEVGIKSGVRSKSRTELCNLLSTAVPINKLGELVRKRIKRRHDWRALVPPALSGG